MTHSLDGENRLLLIRVARRSASFERNTVSPGQLGAKRARDSSHSNTRTSVNISGTGAPFNSVASSPMQIILFLS